MNQIVDFLRECFPYCEKASLVIGGSLGAVWSFLFGETSGQALVWLLIFICSDWATGVWLAAKTGTISSSAGFIGLARKALILAVVALCHGVDVACGITEVSVEAICIGAYAINEAISIIENICLLGYEKYVPSVVRQALLVVKEEQEKGIGNAGKEKAE